MKIKKKILLFFYGPFGPPTNEVMTHACVHINYLKVGSNPGWHYVTQSIIHYRAIGGFFFRIDSETFRKFFRDKDLQKSSSRRSKVSDSRKTSEKYLEVSPL